MPLPSKLLSLTTLQPPMANLLLDAIALSCAAFSLRSWLKRRNSRPVETHPLPPGPKGLPLVGNIFDMPDSDEWEKAREWGETYGKELGMEVCKRALTIHEFPR